MRELNKEENAELANLFHLARVALSGEDDSIYKRMIWASREFNKIHANISRTWAYKTLDRSINR